MINKTTIFASLSCLGACSTPPGGAPESPTPEFEIASSDSEQADYQWEDPECQEGSRLGVRMTTANLTAWDQAKPRDQSVQLGNLVGARGLLAESELPGSVSVRDLFSRTCAKSNQAECVDPKTGAALGWEPKKLGEQPKFCRNPGEYERDSIERITLASSFAVHKAKKFLESALFKANALNGVELKILPEIETLRPPQNISDKGTRVLSLSNISYFPSGNSSRNPFIAVMPRKLGDDEKTPRLWEAPFVIAHELGHHTETLLGIDHFGEGRRSLVRSAVSEGFADLVGFSAQELSDKDLINVPCLKDRAVSEERFSDRVTKVLDKALVSALKNKEAKLNPATLNFYAFTAEVRCPAPSRIEAHGLGAIFAHIVYDFLSKSFAVTETPSSQRRKLFIVNARAWIESVESMIGGGSKVDTDLLATAKATEAMVQSFFASQNTTISKGVAVVMCQRLNFYFSGLGEQPWFGQSTCSKL